MTQRCWRQAVRDSFGYWLGALVLLVVGAVFVAVGALAERVFLYVGIPTLGVGVVLVSLLGYGVYLGVRCPEDLAAWLWWVNYIGGLCGALVFCVPSVLALPVLLLVGADHESLLIGAAFTVVGLAVSVGVWLVARRGYEHRPRAADREDEALPD